MYLWKTVYTTTLFKQFISLVLLSEVTSFQNIWVIRIHKNNLLNLYTNSEEDRTDP